MKLSEQFSKENIEKEIRQKIVYKFGENHNIKLALFKPESNYDDEWNNWDANLILIDKDYNEIDHTINADSFLPDYDQESELHEETGEYYFDIEDITIKF